MFRYEFVVKNRFFDGRCGVNVFSRENAGGNVANEIL